MFTNWRWGLQFWLLVVGAVAIRCAHFRIVGFMRVPFAPSMARLGLCRPRRATRPRLFLESSSGASKGRLPGLLISLLFVRGCNILWRPSRPHPLDSERLFSPGCGSRELRSSAEARCSTMFGIGPVQLSTTTTEHVTSASRRGITVASACLLCQVGRLPRTRGGHNRGSRFW